MGQTTQSQPCSITEKPLTGLDECLRILLLCFRARNSGQAPVRPRGIAKIAWSNLQHPMCFKCTLYECLNASSRRVGLQRFLESKSPFCRSRKFPESCQLYRRVGLIIWSLKIILYINLKSWNCYRHNNTWHLDVNSRTRLRYLNVTLASWRIFGARRSCKFSQSLI